MPPRKFHPGWNPHYNFDDPANRAEIARVDAYDPACDPHGYEVGQIVTSPWGANRITYLECRAGQDHCLKEIIINPGSMLSLQRHRGRSERWDIVRGTLCAQIDDYAMTLHAGDSLSLPKGAPHAMWNIHDEPVCVIETQDGIAREADNIRLVDCHGRPVYPLTSEGEFHAAQLYARVQDDLAHRRGRIAPAHPSLLKAA